jgi:uncharacterized protein YciI
MFVVLITYQKPLEQIELWIEEHRDFLKKYYASGHFLASGRKQPRTGGVILSRAQSLSELENILHEDPFYRENLAAYEIVEFIPGMTADGLQMLLET